MEALVRLARIAAVLLPKLVQLVLAQASQCVANEVGGGVERLAQEVIVHKRSPAVYQVVVETYTVFVRHS